MRRSTLPRTLLAVLSTLALASAQLCSEGVQLQFALTGSLAIADGVASPSFDAGSRVSDLAVVHPSQGPAVFDLWTTSAAQVAYTLGRQSVVVVRDEDPSNMDPAEGFLNSTLAAAGPLPNASSPALRFAVSPNCTEGLLAVVTLMLEFDGQWCRTAVVPVSFALRCERPGCTDACALHGECNVSEGVCQCASPWEGSSCDTVLAGRDLCPGEELVAAFNVSWEVVATGTSYVSAGLTPLGGEEAIMTWHYFFTQGGTLSMGWPLFPSRLRLATYFSDGSSYPSFTTYYRVKDWSECGHNFTCSSDGQCAHGSCIDGRCVCTEAYWWSDCSRGCGVRPGVITEQQGTISSDDSGLNSPGYLNYGYCRWNVAPRGSSWDVIVLQLEEVDLSDGDTLAIYDGNGEDPDNTTEEVKPLITFSIKSKPRTYQVSARKLIVTFTADYTNTARGFVLKYSTMTLPRSLSRGQIAGIVVGCGSVFILVISVMGFLYRRSMTKIKRLEEELNSSAVTNVMGTPAEDAVRLLTDIKKKKTITEHDAASLATIITAIAHNRLFKVELKQRIVDGDVDSEVGGYLFTTLQEGGSFGSSSLSLRSLPGTEGRTAPALTSTEYLAISSALHSWAFDVTKYETDTILQITAMCIFDSEKCIACLGIDRNKLLNFVVALQSSNTNNPYHNNRHAADVMQCVNFLIHESEVEFTDIEVLSALIACMCHDYKHPGVNVTFLQQTLDPLVFKFNGVSVLESMHASEAFALLLQPEYNFVSHFSKEMTLEFHRNVVSLILSTDMSKHIEQLGQINARFAAGIISLVMMQMLMKFADISNPARPWSLCKVWCNCVTEEFFQQGDREKKLGLPVSPFMDRATTDKPKLQAAFIQYFVAPVFELVAQVVPTAQDTIGKHLRENAKEWSAMTTAVVAPRPSTTASMSRPGWDAKKSSSKVDVLDLKRSRNESFSRVKAISIATDAKDVERHAL
eukprot:m51a1_g6911 putative camp phosphodiesterase a (970) ;mRNA; r:118221-121781